MTYLWLFLLGTGVGALSGLLGIGGGIALVPGLVLLFGFKQSEAQGTSLAVLSLPVVLFAAIRYYQADLVRLPVAGWVALGFVLGAYLGAELLTSERVPLEVVRLLFGCALLYVGFMFVLDPGSRRSAVALPAGVGAFFALVVGRWLGRWRSYAETPPPPPPGEDVEYHI